MAGRDSQVMTASWHALGKRARSWIKSRVKGDSGKCINSHSRNDNSKLYTLDLRNFGVITV